MKLDFKDLRKAYADKEVLKGLSFQVESGNILAFLGKNGAGKTTTIRILMNVIKKDSGEITLDGVPFDRNNFRIGYLPEERGMYQKNKILDQLVYFGELKGYGKEEAKKSAKELLEKVGLAESMNKNLETLSKGNQQKVQIVEALMCEPDIIILDEPFSGLDPINSSILKELILEKSGKDKITLFSSHQMGYVDEICTDIAILTDGVCKVNDKIETIKRDMAKNKVFVIPFDFDLESYKNMLSEKNYKPEIKRDRIVVDLGNVKREEFLTDIAKLNVDVDSYGIYKPTIADIFMEYAR
ncbi:MAG: ATP-binding cassette domain-containing protein [Ezakiella sp.]|nr:ATP-binding cassette domain-containing protein [Ezakiella sp.]MDD7471291.1 ATP-binding cassette domain-containing protein [Bacillota bacterium]MDY3923614.1 ATP-binding cassette domain-containing protein [Ezakiella sp.]